MDKETEDLLQRLGEATEREQDFEKLKLKVQLRNIMAIDNLAESVEKLGNQLISAYHGGNNSSNG